MNKLLVAITFLLFTLASTFSCGNNQNADTFQGTPQVNSNTKSENLISRAYLAEINDNIEIQLDKSCQDVQNVAIIDNEKGKLFIKKVHNNISDIPAKGNLIIYLLDKNGFIKYTLTDESGKQLTPTNWNVNTIFVTCNTKKAIATNIYFKKPQYEDTNKNLIPDNIESAFRDNNNNGRADLLDDIVNHIHSEDENQSTRFVYLYPVALPVLEYFIAATEVAVTTYLVADLIYTYTYEYTNTNEYSETYIEEYTEPQSPSPKNSCSPNLLWNKLNTIRKRVPQIQKFLDEIITLGSCSICKKYHYMCSLPEGKLRQEFSSIVRNIACAYMRYYCSQEEYDSMDEAHCKTAFNYIKNINSKKLKELRKKEQELRKAIKEVKKTYENELEKVGCLHNKSLLTTPPLIPAPTQAGCPSPVR